MATGSKTLMGRRKRVWVRAESGLNRARILGRVRDGDKNDSRVRRKRGNGGQPGACATGAKGAAGTPPHAFGLSPVEPGPVRGRTALWSFFRPGPGGSSPSPFSVASRSRPAASGLLCPAVFPADKQDYRIRACDPSILSYSSRLVTRVSSAAPQGRNTRLRGSRLRVFDGAACGRMIRRR